MSATASPTGLSPVYHPTGLERAQQYQIAAGYATTICKGDPVMLAVATGTIVIGTAAAALLGVFMGVEYTDLTGKPTLSNFWPASQGIQTGVPVNAWVVSDPDTVYEIQAIGTLGQANLGKEFDVIISAGNTTTGISTVALNTVAAATGAQKQFRVVDFGKNGDNNPGAVGDFTIVRVVLAQSQLRAPTVSL